MMQGMEATLTEADQGSKESRGSLAARYGMSLPLRRQDRARSGVGLVPPVSESVA
jgi:hypothetical protein